MHQKIYFIYNNCEDPTRPVISPFSRPFRRSSGSSRPWPDVHTPRGSDNRSDLIHRPPNIQGTTVNPSQWPCSAWVRCLLPVRPSGFCHRTPACTTLPRSVPWEPALGPRWTCLGWASRQTNDDGHCIIIDDRSHTVEYGSAVVD